ncbi:hypothetical protein EV214_10955 [Marinisporobacter balticus]|uniref:Uncharacterized protein n=1 Tax=Marinisporobacter balticus TaxID=2018667 RepID=A0A4V6NPD7_9FIRM|nr:hypothetical protein EV214_10955 [Marinisporobacter balticus]
MIQNDINGNVWINQGAGGIIYGDTKETRMA